MTEVITIRIFVGIIFVILLFCYVVRLSMKDYGVIP